MKDISDQDWSNMATFSNAVTMLIDQSDVTPTEIIAVLEMLSSRVKQLVELKKGAEDGSNMEKAGV